MSWNLFIDDERDPIDVTWGSYNELEKYRNMDWIIARSWSEVCTLILTFGMPIMISFDHDLGKNQNTGYDITKKLVDLAMDAPDKYSFPPDFEYLIHSKNPVGAENIKMYLHGFFNTLKKDTQ